MNGAAILVNQLTQTEIMMLKKIVYAMLVGGVLLGSVNAAAGTASTTELNVPGYNTRTSDREGSPYPVEGTPVSYGIEIARAGDSVFPDQTKSNDYGIRIAKADESVFPDQSKTNDYGIRITMSDIDSPYPDQTKSNDYGTRVAKADSNNPFPDQSQSNDYGIRMSA